MSPESLACLSRNPCHLEADQWSHREPRPLHIALAEWAELVLVAPLSASSLADAAPTDSRTCLTVFARRPPVKSG